MMKQIPRVAAVPRSRSVPGTRQGAALPFLPDTVQLCRGPGPGRCGRCHTEALEAAAAAGRWDRWRRKPRTKQLGRDAPLVRAGADVGLGRAAGTRASKHRGLRAPAEPPKPWQHVAHACEPLCPDPTPSPRRQQAGRGQAKNKPLLESVDVRRSSEKCCSSRRQPRCGAWRPPPPRGDADSRCAAVASPHARTVPSLSRMSQ